MTTRKRKIGDCKRKCASTPAAEDEEENQGNGNGDECGMGEQSYATGAMDATQATYATL